MFTNYLKEKSTKELQSNLKLLKTISIFLIITLIFLTIIIIYGLLTTEKRATFLALFVVLISCCSTLPIQYISIKKIKEELKSRKNK